MFEFPKGRFGGTGVEDVAYCFLGQLQNICFRAGTYLCGSHTYSIGARMRKRWCA